MTTFLRSAILRCMLMRNFQVSLSEFHVSTSYYSAVGLLFAPGLLPPDTQICLLSRLLHRDLSNQAHKNNVQLHHTVPYDILPTRPETKLDVLRHRSFFNIEPDSTWSLPAVDPDVHKPLTISQFLNRKLRWFTLGGQYDWTAKAYPEEPPPEFPKDIAELTHGLFPDVHAEAAIVNLYSPGDTLSIHRDVSERSDAGLVSISIGCDAIFVAGLQDSSNQEVKHIAVRLRSGDAVYMSGPSRFAWHGVPRVLADSCPSWLQAWPADRELSGADEYSDVRYEAWRGWMANKRMNLNIRQMQDSQ